MRKRWKELLGIIIFVALLVSGLLAISLATFLDDGPVWLKESLSRQHLSDQQFWQQIQHHKGPRP